MTLTKPIFREKCLHKIRTLPDHTLNYRKLLLNKRVYAELKKYKRAKILFYHPLAFEGNILKTMQKMRQNCDIFIPFMEGESFKMVPFRLPLKKRKFGIFEAGNTNRKINKVDIAIVPAVGVDGNLQRVGFGKGMYDRFFEKLKKRPYTIFIQPELCYTKEYLCDRYDIDCDLLITPKKTVKNRAKVRK